MATKQVAKSLVEEYYDKSQKWYNWLYFDNESLAMHHGFWDETTRKDKDALINQYKEIVEILKPKDGELILDAGCGVGGASIWLAENTGANFEGITLSQTQLCLAKKYALKRGIDDKVHFHKVDYFKTGFKDGYFDKIFGIESFCHSYPNSIDCFKEMYRILKPEGAILISDGFLSRKPQNLKETGLCDEYFWGFKLSGLNTKDEMIDALKRSGFKNIRFIDKKKNIEKSVNKFLRLYQKMLVPEIIMKTFRIVSDTEYAQLMPARNEKKMYDLGIFGYGIFYAEK